jgi:glycosyltransferase involved in cell wall biosynthesis
MLLPVLPEVSIVLPTHDRPGPLRAAVESLLRQEPASRFELIVVDDGESAEARSYLETLAGAGRIVGLRTGGRGAAAARNAGLAAARAPVVACTDDDCEAPPDWAQGLSDRLWATGAAAVGGRVEAAHGTSLAARVSEAITQGFTTALNRDPMDAAFLTSNNVAYRADRVREVGGFDEAFRGAGGEDRDLHARLRQRGGRLVYAPDRVVRHRGPLGWSGLVRQRAAYGRGARLYYARDSARRTLSLLDYARAFGAGFAGMPLLERPAFAFGFLLAQGAVAWGYYSR